MEHKAPPQIEAAKREIGGGVFELALPPVGFITYLILGKERAALIDTGMGVGSLKTAVEQITELPLLVINTHGHPDHCGGNYEFAETYINPADNDVFEKMASLDFRRKDIAHMPGGLELVSALQPTASMPKPLLDGSIDLGDRTIRVVFAPGHTHGSLCVLDENTGFLFAGDNVMRKVSLHEWNSSPLSTYLETLKRLILLNPKKILGGHRPNENSPELLETLVRLVERALAGERGELKNMRGTMVYVLEDGDVCFDFTEELCR